MTSESIEEINFEASSGNVFEDMGLPNPEERLDKAKLVSKIMDIANEKGFNKNKVADILEIDQPKISDLYYGRLSGFSISKLIKFRLRLEKMRYIVYNSKTGKYTGPFTKGAKLVRKSTNLKSSKNKPDDLIQTAEPQKKKSPKANKNKPAGKLSPIMRDLVKLRKSSGLTMTQLADKMNKHVSQILVMETGKSKFPTFDLLQIYAKALGYKVVMTLVKI